jgi:hypothetical protein
MINDWMPCVIASCIVAMSRYKSPGKPAVIADMLSQNCVMDGTNILS